MESSTNKFFLVNYFPESSYWDQHHELFTNNNVIIQASARRIEYPKHWGVLSVKTVLKGRESYFANNNEYRLDKKTYLILNHDQYYSSYIKEDEPVESLSFHFTRLFEKTTLSYMHRSHIELLDDPLDVDDTKEPEFTVTQHEYSENMKNVVLAINELLTDVHENTGKIEELYYSLYSEILHAQWGLKELKEQLKAVKTSTREEVFKRICLAKDYMESNYSNVDLSLTDLSKISCMNSFHLLRCFSQVYNKTPYQYLKEVRLQRAFELLKTKQYSINEVIHLCGYQDPSSFIKAFKSKFNIRPSKAG